MDSVMLSTGSTGNNFSAIQFIRNPFYQANKPRIISFTDRNPRKSLVFASKDESELDEWDKMELKFGKMIGEDPKITLAKIIGRKSNPDMSYLEIEKLLEKKGKGWSDEIQEVPFDVPDRKKSSPPIEGLNLVRPVPKKGTKFEVSDKPAESNIKRSAPPVMKATNESKSSVPNVILRKPSSLMDNGRGDGKLPQLGMKPNLSLKMGKEQQNNRFSDMTLLKKPEPTINSPDISDEIDHLNPHDGKAGVLGEMREVSLKSVSASSVRSNDARLLQKPELRMNNLNEGELESLEEHAESSFFNVTWDNVVVPNSDNNMVEATGINLKKSHGTRGTDSVLDKGSATELQADMWSSGESIAYDGPFESTAAKYTDNLLIGKPKRLDLSSKATDQKNEEEVATTNAGSFANSLEIENFLSTSPIKEHEVDDWDRAEKLVKTGEREEVELISCSTRGFAVSFGSLTGFLPYRNLAARWKFLAFESWLRRKGLDPGIYRQNLGIIGKYDANTKTDSSGPVVGSEINTNPDGAILSDMKLEDLLMIYDQEKLKFLSSFVGQKIKVGVALADRKSRRLIVSLKPKEKEELVEKKKSLMAQLSVGDIVKCCIKKITYFGIFVEVEGVPALIHQTEVSWDATLDPASYFKVGQIVEAKVHQLDFSLERIFLSLKEITPDPLTEALEAVVGDHDSSGGGLEAAQADTEWADVESLIEELQQFDGIQSVSKGRYFLSPGLAPTFQVYMASVFENQYKLLARAGNRVQEILVQTSLGKDDLKSAIMTSTNRVE